MRHSVLAAVMMTTMAILPARGDPGPGEGDTWELGSFETASWPGSVQSAEQVHDGQFSGKWVPSASATIRAPGFPADLSRYDRLVFWLYAARANGQQLTLVCDSENPEDKAGWDYFFYHFRVNWEGWKRFDLGLGTDIRSTRKPLGWHQINYLSFNASGWQHHPLPDTVLYLDGVRLVRDAVRLAADPVPVVPAPDGPVQARWQVTVTNRSMTPTDLKLTCPESAGPFRVTGVPSETIRLAPSEARILAVTMTAVSGADAPPLSWYECLVTVTAPVLPQPPTVRLTATIPMPRRVHPFLFGDPATFEHAQQRAATYDWARRTLNGTIGAADRILAVPLQIPEEPGQWSHHYVCKACGAGLRYAPPKHVCTRCGKAYTGWPYDQVIAARVHGGNLRAVETLGLAYTFTGKHEYAARARENLLAYATAYPAFPLHNVRGELSNSAGRVFAQTLDEAVTVIRVAWGYDLIYNSPVLSDNDRGVIEKALFREMVKTILRNDSGISNWQSWHNAGVAAVGFCLQDSDMVAHALYGKSGLEFQLANSILPDGFWYEGTAAYHYYALDALRWTAEAAHQAGIEFWENASLRAMFDAPVDYVFPDLTFPAVNDSDVFSIKGQHRLYELAYARTGRDPYAAVAQAGNRGSLEALLWGAEKLPETGTHTMASRTFDGLGAAVLRGRMGNGPTYVHVDYGPHGGGHGHYDKLAVILYTLGKQVAPDPGRLAYGAPLQGSWYKQTVAHNTVCIDGRSQAPAAGKLLQFATRDGSTAVQAECDSAYPGVLMRRTLVLTDSFLVDVFEVDGDAEHTCDWVYHLDGKLTSSLTMEARTSPQGDKAGYQHILKPMAADFAESWHVDAALDGGTVRVTMAGVPGTQVIVGEGMTGKPPRPCPVILARRQTARTCYAAVVQAAEGDPESVTVNLIPRLAEGTTAVEVLTGEQRHIIAWNPAGRGGVGRVAHLDSDSRFLHWAGPRQ